MTEGRGKRRFLLLLCFCCSLLFAGLGVWQVERLQWKLDLIARVDARIHAAPVPPPPPQAWGAIDARDDEYRRVRATGIFLHDRETLVDALTERGPGFWVLTPLDTAHGVVLINRGFVPPGRTSPSSRREGQVMGPVSITGLLRTTEPKGRFLRANHPAEGRWYSRDVQAIAAARHLPGVAPYFIDADAAPNPGGFPVGGMTVVRFRNAHLPYALTWFALAGLALAGVFFLRRSPR